MAAGSSLRRHRLVDRDLTAVLDSVDICQLVMASFFRRAQAGQFNLESPEDLMKLLVTMARNKLVSQARREQLRRRHHRQLSLSSPSPNNAVSDSGAGKAIETKETVQRILERLTRDERELAERRSRGESWDTIAKALGATSAQLRKKLSRAFDRVASQLEAKDSHDS